MPCDCQRCREHLVTLGLDQPLPSVAAIKEAYRDVVQVWHPDRFEGNQRLRVKAEEQFKRVQVAYRELIDHESRSTAPPTAQKPTENRQSEPPRSRKPADISFAGAPGCFSAPDIPLWIKKRVLEHLGPTEAVVGAVDLAEIGPIAAKTHESQSDGQNSEEVRFFALTINGLMVSHGWAKNACMRYERLGELKLESVFPIFLMNDPPYPLRKQLALQIHHASGSCYHLFWYSPDDAVVRTVHDFLQGMKTNTSVGY